MRTPNFFIVGAPRCGTTALFSYLKAHPDIAMSAYKEPHYFGTDLVGLQFELFRGKHEQYLGLFNHAKNERMVGEASVYYLFSQQAAAEIHAFDPSAKIIIMLRSPIEVLESIYDQIQFTGDMAFPSFTAMWEQAHIYKNDPAAESRKRFLSGEGVLFSEQVARYLTYFPTEQVHVIVYDDFKQCVAQVYQSTLEFLGVDTQFQPEFKAINARQKARSPFLQGLLSNQWLVHLGSRVTWLALPIYRSLKVINSTPMQKTIIPTDLANMLKAEFRPDVEALSVLLQRDLMHWVV